MTDASRILHCIDKIYEAPVSERWDAAVEAIARYVGGCAGGLGLVERLPDDSLALTPMAFWNLDPEILIAAASRANEEPWGPHGEAWREAHAGIVVRGGDRRPIEEVRATPYYRDVLEPLGIDDALGLTIEKKGNALALATIYRSPSDPRFGLEEKARLSALWPHLRRAVHIGMELDAGAATHGQAAALLDKLRGAAILRDAHGSVYAANEAGEAFLAGPLADVRGGMFDFAPPHHEAFRDALGRLADHPTTAFYVTSTDDPARYRVSLSALPSGRSVRLGGRVAAAPMTLVAIDDRASGTAVDGDWLRAAFALTNREAEICETLRQGATTVEIAEALGLAGDTVRWHMKRVLAKTGARNQKQLVELMSGFPI